MMVEAGLKPSKDVSLVGYSPAVSRLDTAIDAIQRVGDLIVATNQKKGRRTPPSKPQRRPKTAFTRIEHETRLTRHKELTARVLPSGPQDAPEIPRVAGQRRRDRRVLDGTAVIATEGSVVRTPVNATREDERGARWAARSREVGRVTPSSDPATHD